MNLNKREKADSDNRNKIASSNPEQFMLSQPKPKRTFKQCAVDHFCDYCSTTGIHGFSYLGQHRTVVEIIVWTILIILSICASIYMINEIYQKYLETPIIISIASRRRLTHTIPFPAVTICPTTKFHKNCFDYGAVAEKIKTGASVTEEEGRYYDYAKYICPSLGGNFKEPNQQTFSEDIIGFLRKCQAASIFSCIHGPSDCNDDWTLVLTEEGICYTYNMLGRKDIFREGIRQYGDFLNNVNESDWNAETASYSKSDIEVYPEKGLLTGLDNAFTVIMSEPKDSSNENCNSDVKGYKVMLHLPVKYPTVTNDFFYMPLDKMVMAKIKPSMTVTPDSVKEYAYNKRVCYFPSERQLSIFKVYTQSNCLMECAILTKQKKCSCVDFHMPRQSEASICGPAQYNCSRDSKDAGLFLNLINQMIGAESDEPISNSPPNKEEDNAEDNQLDNSELEDLVREMARKCDCLPTCNEISYDVEVSPYEYNPYVLMEKHTANASFINSHHLTQLKLYYSNRYVTTFERNELYGISDFISNFGGLIGLFTGFSIMSGVEIIYFLSLRIWGNYKLFGSWSMPSDAQ